MKTMKIIYFFFAFLVVGLEAAGRSRGNVRYGGRQLPVLRQPEGKCLIFLLILEKSIKKMKLTD